MRNRKIGIGAHEGFTRKFMLRDEEGSDMQEIELGVTVDEYNNPVLHIAPITKDDEMFDNCHRLQYDLIKFCEDAAVGYLEGGADRIEGVHEICRSLRRAAEVLEYKYKLLTGN